MSVPTTSVLMQLNQLESGEFIAGISGFDFNNVAGANDNYLSFGSITYGTDSDIDFRCRCIRVAGVTSERVADARVLVQFNSVGSLAFTFADAVSGTVTVTATSGSVDAVVDYSKPMEIKATWTASTDFQELLVRPVTGLDLTDDTGWTSVASATQTGKALLGTANIMRVGYGASTRGYSSRIHEWRLVVDSTERRITRDDVVAYAAAGGSTFTCSTGQTVTVTGSPVAQVRSLVGGTDVIGDGLSDVASSAFRCSIKRGRWAQLYDDFEAASVTVSFNNQDRKFDPSHATGDFYGELVPGRRFEIETGGFKLVTGYVQDYDLSYDTSLRSVTTIKGTDALGRLAGLATDVWTNSATTAAGKLTAMLDRPEVAWPSHKRDLVGPVEVATLVDVALLVDDVSFQTNVLSYCQTVARSAWLSWFYASADGSITLRPIVVYPDYVASSVGASAASFGGATGIPFEGIVAQYGSETLYSSVTIDNPDEDAETATVGDTAAWFAQYGPLRSLSITGLLLTTSDVVSGIGPAGLATALLSKYMDPAFRITEITVELAALSSTDQDTVLGLDISDVVSISFTPNGVGTAIEHDLAIQGIAHEIMPESHKVTLAVVNYDETTTL